MFATLRPARVSARVPPHFFFLVSAVSRYLGPAFAVLLFAQVSVLGVACLRIASAAAVFAIWRRPWRIVASRPGVQRTTLLALGAALGLMNACFYQAVARLPLGTVGAIEFIGPIVLAAYGTRTPRNIIALLLAACGGGGPTNAPLYGGTLGYLFAFSKCSPFIFFVVFGDRGAPGGAAGGVGPLRSVVVGGLSG